MNIPLRIAHRVNTIEGLRATPREFGVEMDLHAYGDRLVVHHDAMTDALDFDRWLDAYAHAFVILNIKEEGIEARVRETVLARGIERFVLLDLSVPALVKMVRTGERRVAVRVSKYEAVAGALALRGLAEWIWLDVFEPELPVSAAEYRALQAAGFRICLVSPELHGRDVSEIADLQRRLEADGLTADAVCSKRLDRW
jgi:hypothetical protein